jgi:hypothetical protein
VIAFLRDLICRDFWLKLFSLALALLTWVTVYITQGLTVAPVKLAPTETRAFDNLPVVVVTSAEDVRSLRIIPTAVSITVQGEPKIVRRLHENEIRVLVDLTGIQAHHALRRRVEVSMPPGVTHVKVEPEDVQVIYPPAG